MKKNSQAQKIVRGAQHFALPPNWTATLLAALCAGSSGLASAQPAPSTETPASPPCVAPCLNLKPELLRGKSLGSSTVGLSYDFQFNWLKLLDTDSGGSFDADAPLAQLKTEIKGSGTLAVHEERNPRKLMDFAAQSYYLSSTAAGTWGLGGSVKYETEQTLTSQQTVVGLVALASKSGGWLPANSFGLVQFGLGHVNPGADKARQAALGHLGGFTRWEAEGFYLYPLAGKFRSLEFQYRQFQEIGAPSAIRNAGLASHRLGSVRVSLMNGLFLGYTQGSLPFDKRSDRAVSVGVNYKLF